MNSYLIQEAERLCGAQVHDVRGLIATYSNWHEILKLKPSYSELAQKKINEYEALLVAYVQIRKMGRYPDIRSLKNTYLSPVEE